MSLGDKLCLDYLKNADENKAVNLIRFLTESCDYKT